MQQLWFINRPLVQHVSGTIMPIFRSARPYITANGFQHLMCCLESWEAGRQESNNSLYTVHTTCFPASQDSSQHIKFWKPYAVIYGLALLKMGIMVPETCWANDWLINHNCCIKLVSQIISNEEMFQHHWTKLSHRILSLKTSLLVGNNSVMTYKIIVIVLKDRTGIVSNSYEILNKG